VADTSWATYGFAAEVAAIAAEKAFADLRAPVRRVTLPDGPAPVSKPLEDIFHPTPMSIAQACLDVLRGDVQVGRHVADVQAAFAGPY
jgi:pyruvate dehydrogenase E1 component beta subunit